jgi:hypothetical protein
MNKRMRSIMRNILVCAILGTAALIFSGCASIDTYSHSYLGSPEYPPSDPSQVRLITSNPKVSDKQRLGEIVLDIEGEPSREKLEAKLKEEGAKLGADAVVVVSDRTRLVPYAYGDYWGYGGGGDTTEFHRDIVAVAVKIDE